MNNYILLHGSGAGPDMWLPWLKKELEKIKSSVWMPILPDAENPDLKKQLPYLLSNGKFLPETVIVGHSAGCPLILSALEKITHPIKQAILVAGWYSHPGEIQAIWQEKYDWKKIKSKCNNFVFLVSDNDPWGCTDQLSRPIFDKLGGTLIIIKSGGHFGSNTFKQPLYEFPFLLRLISI